MGQLTQNAFIGLLLTPILLLAARNPSSSIKCAPNRALVTFDAFLHVVQITARIRKLCYGLDTDHVDAIAYVSH